MTYYGSRKLAESFRTVRKNTLTIANEIPEDKYSFRATPEVMSVGELLAHIAISPEWLVEVHSTRVPKIEFSFFGDWMQKAAAGEKALRTKCDIVKARTENGDKVAAFVEGRDED